MSHPHNSKLVLAILLIVSIAIGCGSPAAQPPTSPPTNVPVMPTQPPTAAPPTVTPPQATLEPIGIPETPLPGKARIDSVKFNSQALKGNSLGDSADRPLQILLPPDYATSTKRYPVIYYLHGYSLDFKTSSLILDGLRSWFLFGYAAKGAYGDIVTDVEKMMKSGEIQDMILVFPNGGNALGGSLFHSSPVIGDYEKYLTQEIVSYIDSHYRTIPARESRGISGCSMGGDGAAHLGLKYPDVYAVAVPQSGMYFWDKDPYLTTGAKGFTKVPFNLNEILAMDEWTINEIAGAAAFAPDADKPPLYFDMPYTLVNGKAEIDPAFVDKMRAVDPVADLEQYLKQPIRLNALFVQHAANDDTSPSGLARDFDQLLTAKGIPHKFDDSYFNHCSYDEIPPMLKFMSDHLAAEKTN